MIIKKVNQYLGGAVKRKKPKHAGVSTMCLQICLPKSMFCIIHKIINFHFSFSFTFFRDDESEGYEEQTDDSDWRMTRKSGGEQCSLQGTNSCFVPQGDQCSLQGTKS